MQILVVHDSDGVYDAFSGTLPEINDSIRGSKYWEKIVSRLESFHESLSDEEISVDMISNELHHDGDSDLGFTLLDPITPSLPIMTHEEKVKNFSVALAIAGLGIEEKYVHLMVLLYDLILENGGNTNLKQIIHVECEHKKAFPDPLGEVKPKEDEKVSTSDNETGSTDRKPDL